MTLEEQLAFISDVLTYGDLDNGTTALWEDIWWRTDDGYYPVTFLVNCNDLFWWGRLIVSHSHLKICQY